MRYAHALQPRHALRPGMATVCCVASCLLLLLFAAASGLHAEELVLLHPRLSSANGSTIEPARLLTFETDNRLQTPAETEIALPITMGLALDADGGAYVGSVSVEPLRVELLRLMGNQPAASYDTIIDSSSLGFINFIGVDAAVRGDSLYYLQGVELDSALTPIQPSRVMRLNLATGSREIVWETPSDISGLAIDARGHLFVGVFAYDPLTVDVMEIRADRTHRTLGTVFDSSAGATLARPFNLAARGTSIYYVHPRVFASDDTTLIRESIRRLDTIGGGSPVELLSTDQSFEGLTVGSDGTVYYGLADYDPFTLELRSWSPTREQSFGEVIDSRGFLLEQLKIHLAVRPPALPGNCIPDDETLCFEDGRFEVTGTWATLDGQTGSMGAADIGRKDSAALYFFAPHNLEIQIKLLNACEFGSYWLFYSATTNVGFEMRVRDTVTGAERTYSNPVGTTAEPRLDTSAFECGS